MLNVVAGVIILSASAFLGVSIKNVFETRLKIAEDLYKFMTFVQTEISFYSTELSPLITKYTVSTDNDLSEILKGVNSPQSCSATDFNSPSMKKSTKKLASEFLRGIASIDKSSQKEYIESYMRMCDEEIAVLKKESEVKGKMYKRLIPVLGIAAFILII